MGLFDGGSTRALLEAHQADCREDRQRTREAFTQVVQQINDVERRLEKQAIEATTRVELGQQTMHQQNAQRFDKIEGLVQRSFIAVIAALIGVIAFGLQHFLGKYL